MLKLKKTSFIGFLAITLLLCACTRNTADKTLNITENSNSLQETSQETVSKQTSEEVEPSSETFPQVSPSTTPSYSDELGAENTEIDRQTEAGLLSNDPEDIIEKID